MTTGELHGVSYVTETMFQNVTAYALYEPRCAHGKDDGCHGEQRHQVGHYYGAAGQGSVAAHLVCDDVDIDGGRQAEKSAPQCGAENGMVRTFWGSRDIRELMPLYS